MSNIEALILGLSSFCASISEKDFSNDADIVIAMNYPIVRTNQTLSFNDRGVVGFVYDASSFYGQHSNYPGNIPSYTDNGDGTVTDSVTGLIWSESPDLNDDGIINHDDKISLEESEQFIKKFTLAGYTGWKIPAIKEFSSLINISGIDINSYSGTSKEGLTLFIDTGYFNFGYGDLSANERFIDAQMVTTTIYTSTTIKNAKMLFGVNSADGRIKGYGLTSPKGEKKSYAYFVRSNTDYEKMIL